MRSIGCVLVLLLGSGLALAHEGRDGHHDLGPHVDRHKGFDLGPHVGRVHDKPEGPVTVTAPEIDTSAITGPLVLLAIGTLILVDYRRRGHAGCETT